MARPHRLWGEDNKETDEHKIQVQPGQEIGGKGIKHRPEWGSGGILDMT